MKQKQKRVKNTISPDAVCLFRDGDKYFAINDDADVLAKVYCANFSQVLGIRTAAFPANELEAVLNALVRNQYRVALYKFKD